MFQGCPFHTFHTFHSLVLPIKRGIMIYSHSWWCKTVKILLYMSSVRQYRWANYNFSVLFLCHTAFLFFFYQSCEPQYNVVTKIQFRLCVSVFLSTLVCVEWFRMSNGSGYEPFDFCSSKTLCLRSKTGTFWVEINRRVMTVCGCSDSL